MKKVFFTVVIVLFVAIHIFPQEFTVVIAPFDIRAGFSQTDADTIAELFLIELAKNKTIRVIDQRQAVFNEIINRMNFGLSDWANNDRVAQFGEAIDANAVVLGQMMMLGNQRIITARIFDVRTTQILATSRMDLVDVIEVLDKLPVFTTEIMNNLIPPPPPPPPPYNPAVSGYRIGDKGPGGGTVFFAQGGQYMEHSDSLGRGNWREAVRTAENYRGGGFSNWHLPTRREIQLIGNRLNYSSRFWTSEDSGSGLGNAWRYSYGSINAGKKSDLYFIIAVRSFSR